MATGAHRPTSFSQGDVLAQGSWEPLPLGPGQPLLRIPPLGPLSPTASQMRTAPLAGLQEGRPRVSAWWCGPHLTVPPTSPQGSVPPVMAFHLGSLGFLTPFTFESFQSQLTQVIEGALGFRARGTGVQRPSRVCLAFVAILLTIHRAAFPKFQNGDIYAS